MLHEGWVGQDLGGGACQGEEEVWGEALGVECLRESLEMEQGWDVTLAGPDVLPALTFYFSVRASQPSGNLPPSRIRRRKKFKQQIGPTGKTDL